MSTVKGPLIRLILTVAHIMGLRQVWGYSEGLMTGLDPKALTKPGPWFRV